MPAMKYACVSLPAASQMECAAAAAEQVNRCQQGSSTEAESEVAAAGLQVRAAYMPRASFAQRRSRQRVEGVCDGAYAGESAMREAASQRYSVTRGISFGESTALSNPSHRYRCMFDRVGRSPF